MEIDKAKSYVPWVAEKEIHKSMDILAERIKEIRCLRCGEYIKIPLIVRDIDLKILKSHIDGFNKMLDEIEKFIKKHYGIDIRYQLLLELYLTVKKKLLEQEIKIF